MDLQWIFFGFTMGREARAAREQATLQPKCCECSGILGNPSPGVVEANLLTLEN